MWDHNQQELRIAFPNRTIEPYIRIAPMMFDNSMDGGVELEIAKYLSTVLNFKIRLLASTDGNWGSKVNGSWNGMIGMVTRDEADMALGLISISAERREAVDFSWPIFEENVALISHVQGPLPLWQAPIRPFSCLLWIATLLTLILIPLIFHLLSKWTSMAETFEEILTILLGVLLNQGCPERFKSKLISNFVPFWMAFSLVIGLAYTGSLMSALTVPVLHPPLDSFSEVAMSSYFQLRLEKGTMTETIFHSSPSPRMQMIAQKVDEQSEKYEHATDSIAMQLMKEPRAVLLRDSTYMRVRRELMYSLDTGETFIHISNEGLSSPGMAIVLKKNCPYLPDVNRLIRRMQEFGLIEKWFETRLKAARQRASVSRSEERLAVESYIKSLPGYRKGKLQILSLTHLQGGFLLWTVGLGLALLSALRELRPTNFYSFRTKQ